MATNNKTTNLNLPRPSYEDSVDVKDIEKIVDTLDAEIYVIKQISEKAKEILAVEELRVQAEQRRVSNETERVKQSSAQAQQEETRVKADQGRTQEEAKRVEAERQRVTAESERAKEEQSRLANEKVRQQTEQERVGVYQKHEADYTQWKQDETNRKRAETRREHNEQEREQAERKRIEAENERVSAEQERKKANAENTSTFKTWVEEHAKWVGEEANRVANEKGRVQSEDLRAKQSSSDHERALQDVAEVRSVLDSIRKLESGQLVADVAEMKVKYATKQDLDDEIKKLIGGASENLDTLKELADLLTEQGSSISSILEQIATKLPKEEAKQLLQTLEEQLTAKIESKANASTVAGDLATKVARSTFEEFKRSTQASLAEKASASDLTRIQQEVGQGLQTTLTNKVDKVQGKGLSTNDYTTEEKQKLARLQSPINNLNSDKKNVPLSASMGKELKRLIDSKSNTPVIDTLDSDSATSALSASKGKTLATDVKRINDIIGDWEKFTSYVDSSVTVTDNIYILDQMSGNIRGFIASFLNGSVIDDSNLLKKYSDLQEWSRFGVTIYNSQKAVEKLNEVFEKWDELQKEMGWETGSYYDIARGALQGILSWGTLNHILALGYGEGKRFAPEEIEQMTPFYKQNVPFVHMGADIHDAMETIAEFQKWRTNITLRQQLVENDMKQVSKHVLSFTDQVTRVERDAQAVKGDINRLKSSIPTGFKGVKVVSTRAEAEKSENRDYLCLILA